MKRINLTIILVIMLVFLFPETSFASGVGSAGEMIGVIEGTKIDPRNDNRYSDKYYFSDNEVNGLKFYDDVVIKYHSYQSDKVYSLNAYARIYSSQERFCLYTTAENKEGFGDVYYLNYILVEGTQTLITYSYSQSDGSFNFVHDKTKLEPSTTLGQRLDYFRQEGFEILECSVPVFSNYDDAIFYINTGEIRNAVYNPSQNSGQGSASEKITSDQIYLDDFQCIYHDAPSLDNCYVEFKYSIPRHLRNIKGNVYIDVFDVYNGNLQVLTGLIDAPKEYFGMCGAFNVSENPYGFSVPISDFGSIQQFFSVDGEFISKREILGNELLADFDDWTIGGVGMTNILQITKSQLFLDIQVRIGSKTLGTNGAKYSSLVDFLDLKNCYYESSTYDDTTETYKPNNDAVRDGYYSVDAGGNYNYHSSDGKTTSITSYDYDNSTNSTQYITNNYYQNGSGESSNCSGEYISINPVDFNQFAKGVEDLLKMFDKKGGLFTLINDVFDMFPADVTKIAVGAISTITIVSLICILRKH